MSPLIVKWSLCLFFIEAYLSKAEIFREKNDITLAILNYSQAIKCRPKDASLYFKRGEMYEKTNKVLAIDDYSKVSFPMPSAPIYRFYIAHILINLFKSVWLACLHVHHVCVWYLQRSEDHQVPGTRVTDSSNGCWKPKPRSPTRATRFPNALSQPPRKVLKSHICCIINQL